MRQISEKRKYSIVCSHGHSSSVGQGTVCSVLCSASSLSFVSSCCPQGFSTQDCLCSEGSQLLRGVRSRSLLLPLCWAQLPLALQPRQEPSACWPGLSSAALSSKHHPWSSPALWESLPESQGWGRVRQQRLLWGNKARAWRAGKVLGLSWYMCVLTDGLTWNTLSKFH